MSQPVRPGSQSIQSARNTNIERQQGSAEQRTESVGWSFFSAFYNLFSSPKCCSIRKKDPTESDEPPGMTPLTFPYPEELTIGSVKQAAAPFVSPPRTTEPSALTLTVLTLPKTKKHPYHIKYHDFDDILDDFAALEDSLVVDEGDGVSPLAPQSQLDKVREYIALAENENNKYRFSTAVKYLEDALQLMQDELRVVKPVDQVQLEKQIKQMNAKIARWKKENIPTGKQGERI